MVQKPEGIGTVPEEVVTLENGPTAHIRKFPVTKRRPMKDLSAALALELIEL